METDTKVKRADFIDCCMNLNNEFEFLDPHSQVRLLQLYNSHFTGSSLWKFSSESVKQLWNSWNVNIRAIFNLPMATHCWIVEQLSGTHAKKLMYSRYITFIENLSSCEKPQVKALLELVKDDQRFTTGSNIRDILIETGIRISHKNTNKAQLQNFIVYKAPEEAKWKIPLLESLIEIRDHRWQVLFNEEENEQRMSEDNVTLMIDQLCIE